MKALEFASSHCPYCGESIDLAIDTSLASQQYVEDCQVCCRPMLVTVSIDDQSEQAVNVVVRAEND